MPNNVLTCINGKRKANACEKKNVLRQDMRKSYLQTEMINDVLKNEKFVDFTFYDDGECKGKVSKDVIATLRKEN